jgi:hypothetical protein
VPFSTDTIKGICFHLAFKRFLLLEQYLFHTAYLSNKSMGYNMSYYQPGSANANASPLLEGSSVPESEARQIVHSVISAFCVTSPHGLSASKYAPKHYEKTEPQRNKSIEFQKNSQTSKPDAVQPLVKTKEVKYDVADVDDTSAFLAAMNHKFPSTTATYGIGERRPSPAFESRSEFIKKANFVTIPV